MGCVAVKVPLVIYEGGTVNRIFQWKTGDPAVAVNLTGFTAKFTVRAKITDTVALLSLINKAGPWAADTDSGIYLDDADEGKYQLYVKDDDADSLCVAHADVIGVYDLFLYSAAGEALLKQYGKCTIYAAVTR
jgi:hypothetical protein